MLEHAALLLLPWTLDTPAGSAPVWLRRVIDGSGMEAIGFVRFVPSARFRWLPWFTTHRLDVLETDDRALLLTVRRTWRLLSLWDLYDAEERRVGSIYPPTLLDAEGLRRGFLELSSPSHAVVRGMQRQCLAEIELAPDGAARIQFAANLEPNPYLKMLLLAGALTLQPGP